MPAAIAIINYIGTDPSYVGKVLIGKKKSDGRFLSGLWQIPGGRVKEGENPRDTAIREAKEETNLNITIGRYLGSSTYPVSPTSTSVSYWFEGFATSSEITTGDDLEEAKWVLKKDVLPQVAHEASSLWPKEIIYYLSH